MVRRPEATMRLTEPMGKNAVLGDPVQDAVRPHDGRVDRSGEHQRADHGNERAERHSNGQWAGQVHRQPADRIVEEVVSDGIWNDHHGKERDACRENQAIHENDEARFFEVTEFRMLNLPVHLGHRLFAAHSQDRVTEANQDAHEPDGIRERRVFQPAE